MVENDQDKKNTFMFHAVRAVILVVGKTDRNLRSICSEEKRSPIFNGMFIR